MTREKIILCFSGGKDSSMALYELQRQGECEVVALLTTVTDAYDRISMHGVRRSLLAAQAESLGLPLCEVSIAPGAGNDEYEANMGAALKEFHDRGIETVAFGDIFLEDLRQYREERLAQVGMRGIFPIWMRDTRELVDTFIDLGFKAYTSCIDPRVLDDSFAGRLIDRDFVDSLPAGVDPCGENGEFHSFVADGPIFQQPISISRGEVVERDGFVFCDFIPESASRVAGARSD